MAYSPLALANEFIKRAGDQGVSHMKLQKLVYLTHEAWLKNHPEPLINENPEVWQYGPVFNSLYHWLKEYRSAQISEVQRKSDSTPIVGDKPEVQKLIDQIWKTYSGYSAVRLSDLTHEKGSPWWRIAKKHRFDVPMGTEILPELIRECGD